MKDLSTDPIRQVTAMSGKLAIAQENVNLKRKQVEKNKNKQRNRRRDKSPQKEYGTKDGKAIFADDENHGGINITI